MPRNAPHSLALPGKSLARASQTRATRTHTQIARTPLQRTCSKQAPTHPHAQLINQNQSAQVQATPGDIIAMPCNAKLFIAIPRNAWQCPAMRRNAWSCLATPCNARQCLSIPEVQSNTKQGQAIQTQPLTTASLRPRHGFDITTCRNCNENGMISVHHRL